MDYPLRLRPLYKARVWGGDRLLDADLPAPRGPVGERWEVADHGADVSVVANGPLAGRTLRELLCADPAGLVGAAPEPARPDRFPLLLKLIDAREVLSVQVHPEDAYARAHAQDLGKTEAWYVLAAAPGAVIYHGLRRGMDRASFARAIREGNVEACLRTVPARPDTVVYVPAGTVHALGAGVCVAEIQENSDLTYRLYDWGRTGLDGKPRPLHADDGLAVARFGDEPDPTPPPRPVGAHGCRRERLVSCDKFVVDRISRLGPEPATLSTRGRTFHILTALQGPVTVRTAGGAETLGAWHTALVPAACATYTLAAESSGRVLLFSGPDRS